MLIDFRELFPKYNIKPQGVLHIGANKGEEYPVYMELGVRKQIWIEANPEIYIQLRETIKDNPDAMAFNYAIGDKDFERTVLHISNNGSQSSSILQLGTHKQQHPDVHYVKDIPVMMRRIDSLIPVDVMKNYDFLNIDVQGFEGQVLEGMDWYLNMFRWAYLEVNKAQVYEGCWEIDRIDAYMAKYNFKRVETARWIGDWSDALYVK